MIETMCSCGGAVRAAESSARATVDCQTCGKHVRLAAAEEISPEAALGDFDARLIIIAGPDSIGDSIALGGLPDLHVGKTVDRHVCLPGVAVSRQHARLVRMDFGPSRWKLVDSGSRNGVIVNGRRIADAELNDGDQIQIGDFYLRYSVGFPKAVAAVSAPLNSSSGAAVTCPSCKTSYSAKTLICTDCGINIKTGRPLVTAKDLDENDLAIRANTWIRLVSLFIWFGLFPIASEALGTHKPRLLWIITSVTVVVSFFFLAGVISNGGEAPPQLKNYMLWAGAPAATTSEIAAARDKLNRDIARYVAQHPGAADNEEDFYLETAKARLDALDNRDKSLGEFHWYQLFTHALLHGGIMHLAGNLVFLIVFGLRVNELIGDVKMGIIYPLLALCAGGIYAIVMHDQPLAPMLGASGAIMGLAGMYFVFFPVHKVHMAIWFRGGILTGWRVFYKIWKMKGFWLLVLWVGLNDVLPTILGANRGHHGGGVAHWAHLGGFMSGMAIALGLLLTRQVNAHGADILSIALGPKAWALIGKPASRSDAAPASHGVAVTRYPVG